MKIAVCIKRVPDLRRASRSPRAAPRIDETGVKFDINDFDSWAVEAALQLKEKAAAARSSC